MRTSSNELVIDQGNSFTKLGWFSNRELVEVERIPNIGLQERLKAISSEELDILISSVAKGSDEIAMWLKGARACWTLNPSLPLPISIDYKTEQSLGVDRIANACGAMSYDTHSNKLVVDCGTCVTYSVIVGSTFKGGAISPGRMLRFRALHEYTAGLPHIEPNGDTPLLGSSTDESIRSGVENAMVLEIDGMIVEYCKEFAPLTVIITGGDNSYFASRLKSPIFADPELTLKGLHEILHHIKK